MRLFISIELDQNMKEALLSYQADLQFAGLSGSYTDPENLHLTLAFIGEYPDPSAVLESLSSVRFSPFKISLEGAGHFGDLFWAGVSGGSELTSLSKKVRHALASAGIPFDKKRFKPHITLARRTRHDDSFALPELPASCMTVKEISLMRSDRGKRGMIYTRIGGADAEQ